MNRRPTSTPRVLLVEGKDEQRLLPELLERGGLPWPSAPPPIWIEELDGVEKLLDPAVIGAELKASGLRSLGIIVDADGDAAARWLQARQALARHLHQFPAETTPDGVVYTAENHLRVGVWIMPDNVLSGMLETMLLNLRSGEPAIADHVRRACDEATTLGAPFRTVHRDKAELHTWLAWQDPPGQQMHLAMKKGMMPVAKSAEAFVRWVRTLHEL